METARGSIARKNFHDAIYVCLHNTYYANNRSIYRYKIKWH